MCISLFATLLLPLVASAQEPRKAELPKKVDPATVYACRLNAKLKEKLLRDGGGNDATEAGVARGLAWLAKQQKADGTWEFDGKYKHDRVAATGMALLPFLAAGETHRNGKKYKDLVDKGLKYLIDKQLKDGNWKWEQLPTDKKMASSPTMYTHAIATLALCEAAGMTGDEKVKEAATKAVDYIIKAQATDGSWGYTPGTSGDTSIIGWQIQALQSAKLAEIPVPKKTFEQVGPFLESVSDRGETYGYRAKGSTHTLTAVGLLCREYMGWSPRNVQLILGIRWMWEKFPPIEKDWNIYYYYYATQVVHFYLGPQVEQEFDGRPWHRDWNPKMRSIILGNQITAKTSGFKAADIGSFPEDNGSIGKNCGKLGTTALAVLTLEVYYRYPPLYQRDPDGKLKD